MLGILDDLVDDDIGKVIAFCIGTFIMTAVIIGVPILSVLSFIFSWSSPIKLITTIVSVVIFVLLWSSILDGCTK